MKLSKVEVARSEVVRELDLLKSELGEEEPSQPPQEHLLTSSTCSPILCERCLESVVEKEETSSEKFESSYVKEQQRIKEARSAVEVPMIGGSSAKTGRMVNAAVAEKERERNMKEIEELKEELKASKKKHREVKTKLDDQTELVIMLQELCSQAGLI